MPAWHPTPRHNLGNDLSDIEQMARENKRSSQIAARHFWIYGNGADGPLSTPSQTSPDGLPQSSGLGAMAEFQSKRQRKKLRAKIRVWFNLFGPKVVEFEMTIHFRSRSWLSPTLQASLRSINIRPSDSPIFNACMRGNPGTVRRLIENGEASINDVDQYGAGLLYVRILLLFNTPLLGTWWP
jgi:hypothetical protein